MCVCVCVCTCMSTVYIGMHRIMSAFECVQVCVCTSVYVHIYVSVLVCACILLLLWVNECLLLHISLLPAKNILPFQYQILCF